MCLCVKCACGCCLCWVLMHIIMYELNGTSSLCEYYASVKQVRLCVLPYTNFQSRTFQFYVYRLLQLFSESRHNSVESRWNRQPSKKNFSRLCVRGTQFQPNTYSLPDALMSTVSTIRGSPPFTMLPRWTVPQ